MVENWWGKIRKGLAHQFNDVCIKFIVWYRVEKWKKIFIYVNGGNIKIEFFEFTGLLDQQI